MRGLLLVLAACGRFGFADHDADAPGSDAIDAPVPTCSGHDEDGDAFPDACDNCPSVANADQRNNGEVDNGVARDEVGDACDPRPTLIGDFILRFEAHDNSAAAQYISTNGTFAWTQDALRLGSIGTNGSAPYRLASYPTRLAFHVRVIDRSPTAQMWFGVWYNSPFQASDPKIFVNGAFNPAGVSAVFSLKEADALSVERFCPGRAGPPTFEAGDSYTLVADTNLVTGGDHLIATNGPNGSWSCSLAVTVPPYNEGFLESFEMTVEFDYFVAYGVR